MDDISFDRLTSRLSRVVSRRATVGGIAALTFPRLADARKRNRRKRKKRKNKVTFNAFGCVNVGGFCKNDGQCCSGICEGKKGKQTCQAHDASTCQAGDDICIHEDAACTTSTDGEGQCMRTTGNGGYCRAAGFCLACTKDADCHAVCGAQAACTVCAGCAESSGTACVGPSMDSCTFSRAGLPGWADTTLVTPADQEDCHECR